MKRLLFLSLLMVFVISCSTSLDSSISTEPFYGEVFEESAMVRSDIAMENSYAQGEAADFFEQHPRILAHNKQIEVAQTKIELAQQSLKPSYSVGASYGYRDNAPMGVNRADFVSLELNFDLPLFPDKRQKPLIRASQYNASAKQIERTLIFKDLFSSYQQAMAELAILDERQSLYVDTLLSQINDVQVWTNIRLLILID